MFNGTHHILTHGVLARDRGLWYTGNALIRGEIEGLSTPIPTRILTQLGIDYYYMDKVIATLSRESHRALGVRPVPKNAIYYMRFETVLESFQRLKDSRMNPIQFEWLQNLLLDHKTFRAILKRFPSLRSRDNSHFKLMPNIKILYIGFPRRWSEIVLVEGTNIEDVLITVKRNDTVSDELVFSVGQTIADLVELQDGLMAIIKKGIRESIADVEALKDNPSI
ncbi:hypothetical protein TruAng_012203 [Truncatella angustata]|nr:hypothetical protein TruAng_012203 [Truncatella angustata]